jgi:hypothetical protein
MAKETYSITGDFSSGVNQSQLHVEIEADGTVGPLLDGVHTTGDVCCILLTSSLNGSQKTQLDALIAAHSPAAPSVEVDEGVGVLLGEVHFKQIKTESTTSSGSAWKNKITLTLDANEGKHRISWGYLWKYNHHLSKFNGRLSVDGTPIWEHEQEPKDVDNWHPSEAKLYETLTEGAHVITLDFKSSQNGKTARMKNAIIEIKEFRED